MKVSELVAALINMPQDYEVYYEADAGYAEIEKVESSQYGERMVVIN